MCNGLSYHLAYKLALTTDQPRQTPPSPALNVVGTSYNKLVKIRAHIQIINMAYVGGKILAGP